MPHIGQKRRNSIEATCDSSQCAFCYQRAQSGNLAPVQTSCSSDSHGSTGASPRLPNEFRTWLQAQGSRVTAHEQIDFGKIGLPSSQVVGPPSKRNRTSLDLCEASSSDSSDPSPDTFATAEQNSSLLPMPALKTSAPGTPWVWSNDWADQSNPRPGTLVEVCSFSAPFSRGRSLQHTADIVCGVEFSPDGKFLATAGVAKQVFALPIIFLHNPVKSHWQALHVHSTVWRIFEGTLFCCASLYNQHSIGLRSLTQPDTIRHFDTIQPAWCFCSCAHQPVQTLSTTNGMQVRLYSSAHLHSFDSGHLEKPVTVQRLPSKLSSLAWDHSQQVHSHNQE